MPLIRDRPHRGSGNALPASQKLLPGDGSTDQIRQAFPSRREDFRGVVGGLIGTAALVGIIVLLGWIFHVEPMKRIAAGLTSMNPVTALCFEVCCVVMWLLRDTRPKGARGTAAQLLPLLPMYVGASKILDLTTGTSLCPDALLFTAQLDYGQVYPSRMAPNVALSFVLLSMALLAMDRPRWPSFLHPQWLVTPILCAAFAALVGYGYDTSGFYKYKQYIPMALHSAFCFVVLAVALILSRPDQGYLQLIPRGSPGARSYARLLPACVLIPALLGGLALFGADSGWFSARGTGTSIATVLTILAMSILAFLNSVTLNRTESIRRLAEVQLKALVAELDKRNIALHAEVEERQRLERRAEHQAMHDALTGLPNRLLFHERLQQSIDWALRQGQSCALFYVDVDNFKPINDVYGHQVGDALLQQLAQRLKQAMRDTDFAARLGGDEFAAIMAAPITREGALELAGRLAASVAFPYRIQTDSGRLPVDIEVGVSVGVALCPTHACEIDALVSVADSAMYRAKRSGKAQGHTTNIELATAP